MGDKMASRFLARSLKQSVSRLATGKNVLTRSPKATSQVSLAAVRCTLPAVAINSPLRMLSSSMSNASASASCLGGISGIIGVSELERLMKTTKKTR
eukprot:TRINITY_DN923_c0_g1_i2.p1 TRINITY_DN923_c0_g1~~TRINITY_DN923_c0_g1_i2.p1  ORF type:complete len:107 (+),score=18.31 TRINITY_DN923_c0_g1_i2:33-323(+)